MVDSQKRIAGAFLAGTALVAFAFIISRESSAQDLGGIVVERKDIKTSDSNSDGVPDWQDGLMQDEPIILPTASSTYEEPTTVTGKFALRFFEDYVRSKAYGAFGDTNDELVNEATSILAEQAADELFTEEHIVVFPQNDTQTLHSYGNQVALIILAHPNKGDSEAIILQDYMRYGKPERLLDLKPIALAYTTMVKELLETPVPEGHVVQHLNLVNALNAIREDIRGMEKVEEDPLYTLLRMKRYEDDVLGLSNAFTQLFNALHDKNVRWSESEPVTELITFPS